VFFCIFIFFVGKKDYSRVAMPTPEQPASHPMRGMGSSWSRGRDPYNPSIPPEAQGCSSPSGGCSSEDAQRAGSWCRSSRQPPASPPTWDTSGDCDQAYHSDHTSSVCSCGQVSAPKQDGISPHRPLGLHRSCGCDQMPRNSHNASW